MLEELNSLLRRFGGATSINGSPETAALERAHAAIALATPDTGDAE